MARDTTNDLLLTKILATLGPASEETDTIVRLIQAGVRVFRINFSHGAFDDYERMLRRTREASRRTGIHVGVMGDLTGPKIRVGEVVQGGVELREGDRVEFQRAPVVTQPTVRNPPRPVRFSTTYPALVDEVREGQPVLLDDGRVRLVCSGRSGEGDDSRLVCEVLSGGVITSSKGVNLPESDLSVPSLTEKDHRSIEFAVDRGFDYLALSFVRSGDDVRELKERLRGLGVRPELPLEPGRTGAPDGGRTRGHGGYVPVVSKIEKPQALADLDAIVRESDAIMVARGDLGVEMDLADVPVLQKRIIERCHDNGKPVIVATQMLESMIFSPTPTRAEVSDVANAIFDGADAVMLSGETAVGRWPTAAAQMMHRVAKRANEYLQEQPISISTPRRLASSRFQPAALARGVAAVARDLDARLVVLWAGFDGSAVYLSLNRLSRPVVAFSAEEETLRRMTLLYGVHPTYMPQPKSTGEFMSRVDDVLVQNGWASPGDPVVFVLGEPIGRTDLVNKIAIHHVGEGD